MKLRKLIPITGISTVVAGFAPIGLTSCGQYRYINVLNGFKPNQDAKEAYQFKDIEEAAQLYLKLDKHILSEDYIWSLGEYVKENMEFPSAVFPFKFTKIDQANVSIEDWFTQKYKDESRKDVFATSFSSIFQIAGETKPRIETNGTAPLGDYLPNSYVYVSLWLEAWKVPYVIKNKTIGSNRTDARWYLTLAEDELLKKDDEWHVSATITITYSRRDSPDASVSINDILGCYWHNTHIYDPVADPQKSYLYAVCYDALVYGSYYLKNCTIDN